ncbi:hypothetical protein, partial [Bacillus velezensis]|uniref:hypothetical protein n=1 Tax=Bacillus velezensis TaxID=492670 RepID=UPI0012AFCAEF
MNKRFLTDDELAVVRHYKQCDEVRLMKHRVDRGDAKEFVSLVESEPEFVNYQGAEHFSARKGKIGAAAFIGKDNS